METYLTLRDTTGHASSLAVQSDGTLRVVGVLPHGTTFDPKQAENRATFAALAIAESSPPPLTAQQIETEIESAIGFATGDDALATARESDGAISLGCNVCEEDIAAPTAEDVRTFALEHQHCVTTT